MQPPQLPDDPVSGADVQVVGVAKLHLAPQLPEVLNPALSTFFNRILSPSVRGVSSLE